MLILIGLVPLAYSLNKSLDANHLQSFEKLSSQTAAVLNVNQMNYLMRKRAVLTKYIQTKEQTPEVVPALASMTEHLGTRVANYGDLKTILETARSEIRNDMYLSTTTFKRLDKAKALPEMDKDQAKVVKNTCSNLIHSCNIFQIGLKLRWHLQVAWLRYDGGVEAYCWNLLMKGIGKNHMTYGQGQRLLLLMV